MSMRRRVGSQEGTEGTANSATNAKDNSTNNGTNDGPTDDVKHEISISKMYTNIEDIPWEVDALRKVEKSRRHSRSPQRVALLDWLEEFLHASEEL